MDINFGACIGRSLSNAFFHITSRRLLYFTKVEYCSHCYYVYSTDFDLIGPNNFAYNYNPRAGTSMAAPQVAAVAALLWSHFPHCTSVDIRAALAKSA